MIGKLKKLTEKKGLSKVASDLGYRSSATITNWFKKKSIPKLAREKVKNYLIKKESPDGKSS